METTKQETHQKLDQHIEEMEKDFAEKQKSVDSMPTEPPDSPREKRAKELLKAKEEASNKLIEAKRQKARLLLEEAKQEKRRLNVEIGKLRFPDSTNEDYAKRNVGEAQIASAILLLQKSENHRVIISAMQAAVNVNRIDFASTLLDKILSTAPPDILEDIDSTSKGHVYFGSEFSDPWRDPKILQSFCRTLVEIYDTLGNKEALDKLNKEFKKVLSIEKQLRDIINPVQLAQPEKQHRTVAHLAASERESNIGMFKHEDQFRAVIPHV
jgi:hypothetical protein